MKAVQIAVGSVQFNTDQPTMYSLYALSETGDIFFLDPIKGWDKLPALPKPEPYKASSATFSDATIDDVIDACHQRAGTRASGAQMVSSILKRRFQVDHADQLKPEQYGEAIQALRTDVG